MSQLKAVFKRRNQGHSDPDRDTQIAFYVDDALMDFSGDEPVLNGKTLQEAYEEVGELIGLSAEQVKRICIKERKRRIR
jgi:hypothetical protein